MRGLYFSNLLRPRPYCEFNFDEQIPAEVSIYSNS